MSIIAILVAAAVGFVVGFLIHGPLFGKLWMRLANIHPTGKEKFSDMIPQMIQNYVANIVTAFVLSLAMWVAFSSPFMGEPTALRAAIIGFWLWLGFSATNAAIEVIWMGRKVKHGLFEMAASLVVIVSMAVTLVLW